MFQHHSNNCAGKQFTNDDELDISLICVALIFWVFFSSRANISFTFCDMLVSSVINLDSMFELVPSRYDNSVSVIV